MKKLIYVVALFLLTSTSQAQLPRIIILATGGTIAGAGASADRAGYTAGKIPVEDLIGSIPTVKKNCQHNRRANCIGRQPGYDCRDLEKTGYSC